MEIYTKYFMENFLLANEHNMYVLWWTNFFYDYSYPEIYELKKIHHFCSPLNAFKKAFSIQHDW